MRHSYLKHTLSHVLPVMRIFGVVLVGILLVGCLNPIQERIDGLEDELNDTQAELDESRELPAIDPELGTIRGTLVLPEGAGEDFDITTVSVYSPQIRGFVTNPNSAGDFVVPNLETGGVYDIIATSDSLGIRSSSIGSRSAPDIDPDADTAAAGMSGSAVGDGAGADDVFATLIEDVEAADGGGTFLGNQPLSRTGAISGYVQLDGEEDHTGILVYIPGTSFTARTDTDGSFTIFYVPQGRYRVRFEKVDYTFADRSDIDVFAEEETIINSPEDPSVLFYGFGTVTGTVRLQAADSHGNANVVLQHVTDPNLTYNGVTLDDGTFAIGNVAPGNYTALISMDGYVTAEVAQVVVEGARTIVLEPPMLRVIGGAVAGTVTLSRGEDFGGIGILAERTDGVGVFSTNTNVAGEFSFPSIPPGNYTLTASRAGYSSATISDVVVEVGDEKTGLSFGELGPAIGTITGTVILEGRGSHEASLVTARNNDDSSLSYTAVTDQDGVFVVSDVEPGTYLLIISHDGYVTSNSTSVVISTNEIDSSTDIVLSSSLGRVRGTVTLESGADHTGVLVLAENEDGSQTYTASTAADGTFSMAGMEPGRYRVSSSKDGYVTSVSDWFELGTGQVVDTIVQELSISLRSIVGQVTMEARTDHAGIQITATNVETPDLIYSALANSEGFYALAGMQPGEYIVNFSAAGYRSTTLPTISLDGTSSVTADTLELTRARGTVAGIATLEGRTSHSGMTVALPGTEYTTTTEADGSWEMLVPSGNYPGGVRYEMDHFALASDSETVTVLTDSTYAVPQVELEAVSNAVAGTIDLRGSTDDGAIDVTIDELPDIATTSATDGSWTLPGVPLGTYTLRFTRENTPEVTVTLNVIPADSIDVGVVEMLPDAATVRGYMALENVTDYTGIQVSITSVDNPTRETLTNASGYFELVGVPAIGDHDLTFSKTGWDSHTIAINDLAPLEERDFNGDRTIALSDSTVPSLTGVQINNGSSVTDDPEVTIETTASDRGSGIERMQVSWTGTFDETVPWEPYLPTFTRTLPGAVNGDYTVHIRLRDRAGNVSTAAGSSVSLTDQVKTYGGVLGSADLHWTTTDGVILITDNVLVQSGDELVIDPGVEVRFGGNYYIRVDGTLTAIGTEVEPIVFTTTAEYAGQWNGIVAGDNATLLVGSGSSSNYDPAMDMYSNDLDYDFTVSQGSEIAHARFFDTSYGVQGRLMVRDSYFETSGSATQSFRGYLVNSTVYGSLSSSYASLFGNQIYGRQASTGWFTEDGTAYDGMVDSHYYDADGNMQWDESGQMYGSEWDDALGRDVSFPVYPSTDLVPGGSVSIYGGTFVNNTVEDAHSVNVNSLYSGFYSTTIAFVDRLDMESVGSEHAPASNNVIREVSSTIASGSRFAHISHSTISDNWGDPVISIGSSRDSYERFEWQHNFWGYDKTAEIESVVTAGNQDLSFIEDYYDDFNKSEIDYSAWASEPWGFAGYQGDRFADFTFTIDSGAVEAVDTAVDLQLEMLTAPLYADGAGAQYRVAASVEELLNATWHSFTSAATYTFDPADVADGFITLYAQAEDAGGRRTGIVTSRIAYDTPTPVNITLTDGQVFTTASTFDFTFNVQEYGEFASGIVRINGNSIFRVDDSWGADRFSTVSTGTDTYGMPQFHLDEMAAGTHTVEIYLRDETGKESTTTIGFTIERTVDSTQWGADVSWNSDGTLIKDTRTQYLWRFDGAPEEVAGGTALPSNNFDATAGFGSAVISPQAYESTGINLDYSRNEFTAEFWAAVPNDRVLYFGEYSGPGRLYIRNGTYNETTDYIEGRVARTDGTNSASWYRSVYGYTTTDLAGWHHYAAVYNGEQLLIYRDGTLVIASDTSTNPLVDVNRYLRIYGSSEVLMDELRFSTHARSADELTAYVDYVRSADLIAGP